MIKLCVCSLGQVQLDVQISSILLQHRKLNCGHVEPFRILYFFGGTLFRRKNGEEQYLY